ncbi:carbamate kinase [Intestinimonas butyriciproducens]|jgi:carbamate kinase|uniref:Carbamate kinase n=1 Tax=Intestinimonas butyriciproducens TaxID=1297617 RepID=A0A0S2W8P6_9FIRM|nr:carbamate kinase [Intestinimonas butyriciproducens]ALP95732.1 Carbamate kinase [Intestinimonas butyriciproducens]
MKPKRIVLALGGNALGENLPEQMKAVKRTVKTIADLLEEGHQMVITHGNGPQVGMINMAMTTLSREDPSHPMAPLSVCTAMSQGYIGYDLQNALREELLNRGVRRSVATVLTQVEVDPTDPAFQHPTKPIGAFMTQAEAEEMRRRGNPVMEDAGRGWRRVVASPRPRRVVELDTIRTLADAGQIVIACGGGGIPVLPDGNHLRGAGAVVDKDFTAEILAEELGADCLMILTAVEKVAVHFGKPNQRWLTHMTVPVAEKYIAEGQFAPGSMLPKVEAAVAFAKSSPGRQTLITQLEKALDGMRGQTGTIIG